MFIGTARPHRPMARTLRACEHCGELFSGTTRARYCPTSSRCRVAAWRAHQQAARAPLFIERAAGITRVRGSWRAILAWLKANKEG